MSAELRQRKPPASAVDGRPEDAPSHPAGQESHHQALQLLRLLLFVTYFWAASCTINATQYVGVPLYWINRDYYYAWMALTKQSYGIFATSLQWWAPTSVKVSGDDTVRDQLRETPDGRVELDFPERIVLIANHQIYTDWIYLWWAAYTSKMHGHIYIILKESLKWVPVIGQGMMFFGFIFMSRKMETDRPRMAHRLQKLKEKHAGAMAGAPGYDPMWLLLFPEGTNLSRNTRRKSAAWAAKSGTTDFENMLIPRSTGMYFCLQELDDSVEWVYDCTMAYEGVKKGEYPAEFFTLRSCYIAGLPPKYIHMYWRRFPVKSIPLATQDEFEAWLRARWTEKDALMDVWHQTGSFPAMAAPTVARAAPAGHVVAPIRLKSKLEVGNIFVVLATVGLVANILARVWDLVTGKRS